MPEGMWRDSLAAKARALTPGGLHGPRKRSVTADRVSGPPDEAGNGGNAPTIAEPATELKRRGRPGRRDLAAFAMKPNARASIECKIGNRDVDGLRDAGSRVVECRQESLVSLSGPGGRIWERWLWLVLLRATGIRPGLAMTLHRDGECALDSGDRWRDP